MCRSNQKPVCAVQDQTAYRGAPQPQFERGERSQSLREHGAVCGRKPPAHDSMCFGYFHLVHLTLEVIRVRSNTDSLLFYTQKRAVKAESSLSKLKQEVQQLQVWLSNSVSP